MRQFGLSVALAALLLVSACGNGGDQANGGAAEGGAAQTANGPSSDAGHDNRTAAEIVEAESQARAQSVYVDPSLQPNCSTPVNAGQYPEPELVGVRIGMTPTEAVAAAHCPRRNFHVQSEQTMMDLVGARQIPAGGRLISMHNGAESGHSIIATQTIQILTPGVAGQERVQGVWRTEEFIDATNAPPVAMMISSLTERFGEPTELKEMQQGVWMTWVFSPSGARLEGRDARRCAQFITSLYNGAGHASEDCGLTVQAQIRRTGSYTTVAAAYSVGMANQQGLFRARSAMREQILAGEGGGGGAPDL